ncbi:MAG: hypothetical protein LBC37_03775 [Zoogloeaceae bacterium]|nr:hypothetical protein [Zoogloeaceae bacterium]
MPESWLRLAARALGKKAVADRLLDSLAIDNRQARALGWRPVVTMEEALRNMRQAELSS